MSNNVDDARKSIYRSCRAHTGLNSRQWGRVFALGNLLNTAQVVGHKENPLPPASNNTSKGVNKAEALAAQLLAFIHDQGFDIQAMTFDAQGKILEIPKRAGK